MLHDLPVLTKARLMENFDQVVTAADPRLAELERYLTTLAGDELFRGKYYVSATAGTTGRRGILLWDFVEWVHVISSYNRAFDWDGSTAGLTHRVKAAVVSSTNLSHQSARGGSAIHSRWVPTLRLDSDDPLPSPVAPRPQRDRRTGGPVRLWVLPALCRHLRHPVPARGDAAVAHCRWSHVNRAAHRLPPPHGRGQ